MPADAAVSAIAFQVTPVPRSCTRCTSTFGGAGTEPVPDGENQTATSHHTATITRTPISATVQVGSPRSMSIKRARPLPSASSPLDSSASISTSVIRDTVGAEEDLRQPVDVRVELRGALQL